MIDIGRLAGRRIAQLIESDGPGGAERVVADLASAFQAAGAHSVVFVPADGDGWLARQLEGTGVAIEHFRIARPFSPRCARQLAARFRRHRIDVAHSHEFSLAFYGSWASRLAHVPHVITMHGSRYYAGRMRRRVAMRAAVAMSGRTFAVSASLAGQMARDLFVPRSRIGIVANGVRRMMPGPITLRSELGLGPGDRLLVSVGNLYPVKGHGYLIDAMALLAARPALHLAVSGRGDLASALLARAQARGMEDRVHLLGLRSDVAAILAAADLFVLPSLSEGLPLALLEAMFAGCPIIASAVGDVPEALAYGEAGMLVAPGSAAELAAAMDALLGDPGRSRDLGRSALRQAMAEYDISRMVGRYAYVYAELLADRCLADGRTQLNAALDASNPVGTRP